MAYNNVVKPTSLFDIFEHIVTLLIGGAIDMDKNLKGELAVMDTLGIKPNYVALGRKYGMDPRIVKNIKMVTKGGSLQEIKEARSNVFGYGLYF